jgi:para-nitrobenzyl esterase
MIPRTLCSVMLCLIALWIAGCSKPPAADNVVQIESGMLSGIQGSNPSIRVFKGVPYAAPPVFDLRWRPPQPVAKWEGVYKADRTCAICMQQGRGWGEFYQEEFYQHPEPMSEDCLYLNVWTGAKAGEQRPVLVWIHGGGFAEGSGSLPSFDGETLAQKGLVVVTINYRLSVFGFLAHPELTKESVAAASGNYGLLDQIAALQWVQKNIAAFGGDLKQVTIAGQSAGSASVHYLSVSPLAKGLFIRTIAQSGSGINRVVNTTRLKEAEQSGVKFAASVKAASLRELRGKPAAALLQGEFRMRPIVDGWVLPDDIYAIMSQGRQNDVPMLTGLNSEEQIGFQPQTVKAQEFRDDIKKRFPVEADAFLRLYPAGSDEAARIARDTSTRDQSIVSMRAWAKMRSQTAKTPLYIYYFSRKSPGYDSEWIGAFHSAELEYVFGTLNATDRPWEEADRKLSDTMSSYWANFISKGDPNGPGLPKWPLYLENVDHYFELGNSIGPRMVMPDKAKLEFFEALFARMLTRTP